jgi:glycosyltransferase involved in cell wall biosynthesis
MTGAVGTIVQDGVNGIVVDPHDARALAAAMHRLTDPETARALRQGVRRLNPPLLPEAAADAVLGAVARARGRGRPTTPTHPDHEVPQRAHQPQDP